MNGIKNALIANFGKHVQLGLEYLMDTFVWIRLTWLVWASTTTDGLLKAAKSSNRLPPRSISRNCISQLQVFPWNCILYSSQLRIFYNSAAGTLSGKLFFEHQKIYYIKGKKRQFYQIELDRFIFCLLVDSVSGWRKARQTDWCTTAPRLKQRLMVKTERASRFDR